MRVRWRRSWGVLAGIVVAALFAIQAVQAAPRRKDDADVRRQCRGNLMRVGEALYAAADDLRPGDDRGEGWFLAKLMEIRDRDLVERLRCPADPLAGKRDESLGYRGLISYPIRALDAHPLARDAKEPQVLVVCPHHDDGAFVMTDDFDIRFLTREELGAPESGPIEVGETATHPALRCVRYETRLNEELERELQTVRARTTCANHLRQLGGVFVSEALEKPGRPPHDGPALLIFYRQKHYIQMTREEVLTCPLDEVAKPPRTQADSQRYDELDLRRSVRKWVSFAVRDFTTHPLRSESMEALPLMACIHHAGGANVLFDDGAVQFLDREALGLGPDDELTVGPKSKSPLLRPLTFGPTEEQ